MTDPHAAFTVTLFAYPGAQRAAVYGLVDLFAIASRISRERGGRTIEAREVAPDALAGGAAGPRPDAIILPPSLGGARGRGEDAVHAWLAASHAEGAMLCSVCAGAFWLGHAGLLDGRPATTHWALEAEFRAAFPRVQVNTDPLLIDDNDVVTAGGLMAWIDLGLFLVARWLGEEVASRTARHLLVDTSGREQRTYRTFSPPLTHGDAAILRIQHWLETAVGEDIAVVDMAARAAMSARTFLRRFKRATGLSPNLYLQHLRVEKARGLLERTRLPVGEVGWAVGYRDAAAFSRVFRQATGVTAGDYRQRLGPAAARRND